MNDQLPITTPPKENPVLPQADILTYAKGPDLKPSYFKRHPIHFILFILIIFATLLMVIEKIQASNNQRLLLQTVKPSEFENQHSIKNFRRRYHCESTATFSAMSRFECYNYRDFLYYSKDRTELFSLLAHIDSKLESIVGGDLHPTSLSSDYNDFRSAAQESQSLDAILDKEDGSVEFMLKPNDQLTQRFGSKTAIYVCVFQTEISIDNTRVNKYSEIAEPPCGDMPFMGLTHAILPYLQDSSGYVTQVSFKAFKQEHNGIMGAYELIY
jgi:hypothetical protein